MAKKRRTTKRVRKKKGAKNQSLSVKIAIGLAVLLSFGAIIFYVVKTNYSEFNSFDSDKVLEKYEVKGIDVSHHNPVLNWKTVAQQNIAFAYLKSTEDNLHIDRNYKLNNELARENNVRIGAYHFYRFGLSGEEQARHFIANTDVRSGDFIPAIDVEHSVLNPFSSDADYRKGVIEELKLLENCLYEHYGVHPLIYTNQDCYKLYVKNNFPENQLWMCDLHKEPNADLNWVIWQFSHKGKIDGLSDEYLDLNYFRYSFDDLKKYLIP